MLGEAAVEHQRVHLQVVAGEVAQHDELGAALLLDAPDFVEEPAERVRPGPRPIEEQVIPFGDERSIVEHMYAVGSAQTRDLPRVEVRRDRVDDGVA